MPDSKDKRTIKRFAFLGDSLTDRGTMNNSKLFGIISMKRLAGLKESPLGRFTNGYTWADYFTRHFAVEGLLTTCLRMHGLSDEEVQNVIETLKEKVNENEWTEDQIAGYLQTEFPKVYRFIQASFTLDNYRHVYVMGQDLACSYAIGGMTSAEWDFFDDVGSPKESGARVTVETLADMRKEMIRYDKTNSVSQTTIKQTLVSEWSGGNDLITVNKEPSPEIVKKTVKARLQNIEKLIKHGYQNFMILNMPNLSLTPRFQKKRSKVLQNTKVQCERFNEQLERGIKVLRQDNPDVQIEIFDAYTIFNEVYANPEEYGFDEALKTKTYVKSDEFNKKDLNSPDSQKYMWWNDVHPTASLQSLLGNEIRQFVENKYEFESPIKDLSLTNLLIQRFKVLYNKKLNDDRTGFFGWMRKSRLKQYDLDLTEIFYHALYNDGGRSKEILEDLNWIDSDGDFKRNTNYEINNLLKLAFDAAKTQNKEENADEKDFIRNQCYS